jgi:hypothetical protein
VAVYWYYRTIGKGTLLHFELPSHGSAVCSVLPVQLYYNTTGTGSNGSSTAATGTLVLVLVLVLMLVLVPPDGIRQVVG